MTAVDHNHMLEGGFFMVMHSTSKGPVGEIHELAIMGYDAEKKAYTYNSFSNFGEAQFFTGTLQGDTWTWHAESKMNGQITKQRFTLIEVSPSSYTFRFDVSADGATWTNVVEGKATKVK